MKAFKLKTLLEALDELTALLLCVFDILVRALHLIAANNVLLVGFPIAGILDQVKPNFGQNPRVLHGFWIHA